MQYNRVINYNDKSAALFLPANHKKYGFSDAMTKPYQLNELMKVLDPICGNA